MRRPRKGPFYFQMVMFSKMVLRRFSAFCVITALASFSAFVCAQSASEVYVCTDASGVRTYQNTNPSDQCKRMNLNAVLSVPQSGAARPGAASATAASPQSGANGAGQGGNRADRIDANGGQSSPSANMGSAANPRDSQSAREADRIRILEIELKEEERRLQGLQQRQQSTTDERLGQDIARSQASLDALKRELAKARRP